MRFLTGRFRSLIPANHPFRFQGQPGRSRLAGLLRLPAFGLIVVAGLVPVLSLGPVRDALPPAMTDLLERIERPVQDRVWAGVMAGMRAGGLTIGEILVEGRKRTGKDSLLNAIGSGSGDLILVLDLDALHRRIIALPWVKQARIERRLPDILFVRLVEREPMAILQRNGVFMPIDHDGVVIAGVDPAPFTALPVVIGEDVTLHVGDFLRLLGHEPELRQRVRAVTLVGHRRWDVRLDNQIDIQLPETDPLEAWSQLAALEREHGVLQRDVILVDMRVRGQLVVRVAPDAAKRLRSGGRET